MRIKRYFLFPLIAILNSFLFLIIPDYYFWFLAILVTGAFICLGIVITDLFGKTSNWKGALIVLGFGISSYIIGLGIIIIWNKYF